jgi:enterochelin esterase family protein
MTTILILIYGLLLWSFSAGQTNDLPVRPGGDSPRIDALSRSIAGGDAQAVARFWQDVKSTHAPLIEPIAGDKDHRLVTFIYQGTVATRGVALLSQLTPARDPAGSALSLLPGTNVWFKSLILRNDLRVTYGFTVDPTPAALADAAGQVADPLNPPTLKSGSHVGRSYLELPGAVPQPWIVRRPNVPAGVVTSGQVQSGAAKTMRKFWVYTPARYDAKRAAPYPLLVCFDGTYYIDDEEIPVPVILDNLIAAGKIPPMLAVFIDAPATTPMRVAELTNDQAFLDLVANDLLPQVRTRWRVTADPTQTVVTGSSAGGVGAAFFAWRRPDLFGNVISQSGAYWHGRTRSDAATEWLTEQYRSSPKAAVRFVLQVGVLETWSTPGNGPSMRDANRHLRDVLVAKGYEVHFSEIGGGHETVNWRGGLGEGLVELFGVPAKVATKGP